MNAAVSRDGRYLATASSPGERESAHTTVYDLQSGEAVRQFSGSSWSAAFSPDTRLFAIGMADESRIRLFDLEKNEEKWSKVFCRRQEVKSLAFSEDGKRILAGILPGAPYLVDAEIGAILKRYGWSNCSGR